MSINLLRYSTESGASCWGVVRGERVLPLPGEYPTAGEVLQEGAEVARALLTESGDSGIELADVTPLNPLPGAKVNCQGTNYRAHMVETGVDPDQPYNLFFTKSTGSLTGARDDIVTPPHVRLLDYEIELGIVIGKAITGPVTITAENLPDYVGAFVVANDVSARDVQLSQGQYYKGKSYRTFCPVGPYLCVPDPGEVHRWKDLRLRLVVNDELRQTALATEMVFTPARTLTEFSQLEDFAVGDLLLTGTPGGVAIKPPKPIVQRLAGLLPEAKKWNLFIRTQSRNRAYLAPGDVVTASIRTDDGVLDLGTQRNTVR
ncbi:fumarylacetoacetate hydrolase family protein [Nocardia violaceofusca]|uniref:fumarylacetoacetate hydrolase family protein n=1 Tax=Nocardia violaceofusca TaxID=941182 RepID=UPI0007A446E2|nr:fumarylacetoacetate hydrolase family protein [Nocardia violaceofusca]